MRYQVQNKQVVCDICQKKCKSKCGLKRHMNSKHRGSQEGTQATGKGGQQSKFTAEIFASMVDEVKVKIASNKVFPRSLRDELRSYIFPKIGEDTTEFSELRKVYQVLAKNGDPEKFYAKFYSTIPLNAMKYFEGLSRNAATLLSTKLADRMLAYSKEKGAVDASEMEVKLSLSDKEMAGLQYIGGYVLHNLHNKHVNSKNWKSTESQQSISILKAGKVEDPTVKKTQKLISSLNRGGLWAITKRAQTIFLRTEYYFRMLTSKPGLQRIDIASITSKSTHDGEVVSAYNAMVFESELVTDDYVGKDVLQNIVDLYVRVRSFSFAKDIIQKHKMKGKQLKAKALRKEISRASAEFEVQRHL